ncbi:T9SS type B sorting domain-containing protein [Salegentibacter salegens]|uniref:Gliding motility-associated C-terminal domain-containing protein n=1 Tax=Salegentibacter salegens TaxID=143223 RepID=A0A1M7I4A8_9FLAO|nr:T9SS type B sorting domain-containing protein [Salegentibacter salegens]PRX42851.1 gliding motility-associated-like protein [Salegentibacter salegens]SHM35621.1 gliding motility-associated C-terminal domain-containing protein [Salegentibacter salegens]
MKQESLLLFCIFFLYGSFSVFGQGSSCESLDPFCAGDEELVFPNSNSTNSSIVNGEPGPDYGCLLSQPYPAWFYLQVEETGNLRFNISQFQNENGGGSQYDVDFIVWGPFERTEDYCTDDSLSELNIVDCSYEPDTVEQMYIPNAEAGQVYVVLITNYEELPGFISLRQTNSDQATSGSTDCGILDEVLGPDRFLCGEDETTLDATTEGVERYEWFQFNETTDDFEIIANEENPTLTLTDSGRYKVIVYENITGQADEDEIEIKFYNEPVANVPDDLYICDPNQTTIDLTSASAQILNGNTSEEDYRVNFYETAQDIEDENSISNPSAFPVEESREIFAQVEGVESGCVSQEVFFSVELTFVPENFLPEESVVCVDLDRTVLAQQGIGEDLGADYEYEWIAEGNTISTEAVLNFTETPNFNNVTLIVTDNRSGCNIEFTTALLVYSRPENVLVEIEGSDFTGGYIINAEATKGIGGETTYEYRADNGAWQESAVFRNLDPGYHTISAREINGCGITTSEEFYLVGYPRFFTPNSDGYNDTWNIENTAEIQIKKLYVFDRYGKLIKELTPNGEGWDGTYNGRTLPADDYWFRVEFEMQNGTSDHYGTNFTLKR